VSGVYGKLLESVRERLEGFCHVIENVPGAPIPNQPALWGQPGVMLCGTGFGLGIETPNGWREVRRHRLFESTVTLSSPGCRHRYPTINPYNALARKRDGIERGADAWYGRALGMDWEPNAGQTREAIPPVYTEWIGRQLLASLEKVA
jgi:DNA (cytosine-5)-methyltransferase 1